MAKKIIDLPAKTSTSGTDFIIIEDMDGVPVTKKITVDDFLASGGPPVDGYVAPVELCFVAGQYSTGLASYQRIGGRSIDITRYPSIVNGKMRSIVFEADLHRTGGSTSVDIQIMDIVHSVEIVGTNLSSVSSALTKVTSSELTVGAADGDIRSDAETLYEVKIKMTGGTLSDQVYCTSARLLITYL